jgi:hypothetical protein
MLSGERSSKVVRRRYATIADVWGRGSIASNGSGRSCERRDRDPLETLGAHVNDAVDVLHRTFDEQHRRGVEHETMLLEHVWHDDRVRRAGLILERQEKKALRRARALPNDHVTRFAPREAPRRTRFRDGGGLPACVRRDAGPW